jgi:hypothetical protein
MMIPFLGGAAGYLGKLDFDSAVRVKRNPEGI